jgi:hypothetical protein
VVWGWLVFHPLALTSLGLVLTSARKIISFAMGAALLLWLGLVLCDPR